MSMTKTDKQAWQALREAAHEEIMCREVCDTSDKWQDEATPEAVLALLDELEAKDLRVSDLERELVAMEAVAQALRDEMRAAAGKGE